MKNRYFVLYLVVIIIIASTTDIDAQCAMCKLSAETNLQNGGTEGKGLNAGILYLLSLPYLLFCTFAFIWWKKKKANH
jgi:hypothetical protein